MRKRKKILKNLSSEIFNDKKEDTNYDIFADKDNLIIEDNNQTPKLEEDNSIELGEINNILQNKIEDKNDDNSINELKVTPIFPDSEIKEENNKAEIEDTNNSASIESVFPEINNENTSTIDTEQPEENSSNIESETIFSDVISSEEQEKLENDNTSVEPVFPEINEENTSNINTEESNEDIQDNKETMNTILNEFQEDKTSLNELISSDNSSLSEIEKDLLNEEEDDTTFNELNERINEDINLDNNTSEDTKEEINLENDNSNEIEKEENIDDNINDNEEPEIVGNFPKISKFGSVVPNK